MHVLVVDDDPQHRRALSAALAGRGHEVSEAADGEAALRLAQERPFAIVLASVELRRLDGLELCRRIRALPNGDRAVVLLMPTDTRSEDLRPLFQVGADDFVAKPVDLITFGQRLAIAERMAETRAPRPMPDRGLPAQLVLQDVSARVRAQLVLDRMAEEHRRSQYGAMLDPSRGMAAIHRDRRSRERRSHGKRKPTDARMLIQRAIGGRVRWRAIPIAQLAIVLLLLAGLAAPSLSSAGGQGAPRVEAAALTPTATPSLQPGCTDFNPNRDLSGDLFGRGTGRGTVLNASLTCTYQAGIASYVIPSGNPQDTDIPLQILFSSQMVMVAPGQTLTLSIDLPPCAYQLDLFRGSLLPNFVGQVYYNERLLGAIRGSNGMCTTPTATSTSTMTPTATSPPTATLTRSPTATSTATPIATMAPTRDLVCTADVAAPLSGSAVGGAVGCTPTVAVTTTVTATRTLSATTTVTATTTLTATPTPSGTATATTTVTGTSTETGTTTGTATPMSSGTTTMTATTTGTATETGTTTATPTSTGTTTTFSGGIPAPTNVGQTATPVPTATTQPSNCCFSGSNLFLPPAPAPPIISVGRLESNVHPAPLAPVVDSAPQPAVPPPSVQPLVPVPQELGIQDVAPRSTTLVDEPSVLSPLGGITDTGLEPQPAPVQAPVQDFPSALLPVPAGQIPSTGGANPTLLAVTLGILCGVGLWLRIHSAVSRGPRSE